MEILKLTINNAIFKVKKDENKFVVSYKFENDFIYESTNFDTFEKAKKFVDNQVNQQIRLINELKQNLIKAMELAEKLNFDIVGDIDNILEQI